MRGNTVSINGNLTRDAEVRTTASGKNAVSWSVAWSKRKKNQAGEWEDEPHFFDVEAWMSDAQLNILQDQLVKGAGCAVIDGHLEFQSWKAQDGSNRSRVIIRCDDPVSGLRVSPPRRQQYQQQQPYQPPYQQQYQQPQQQYQQAIGFYDSDIPF